MRVLVTGGNGFIGTHVQAELERGGHQPVGYDRPRDVTHFQRKTLNGIGAVIHLAGILGTSETMGADRQAVETNIGGTLRVADACADAGIPMVNIATGHRGQPNPYAITKAAAEDLLLARAQWQGHQNVVVRAFHVYGPGQKPAAPHGKSPVRKIIPSFVCRALTGMPLEVTGTGRQLIDLVYVTDVAQRLCDALSGPYGFTVEAGTGNPVSVVQAASDVVSACRSQSKIVRVPMRPGEPEWSKVVSVKPMADALAWPGGLPATISWYIDLLAERAA